MPLPGGKRKSLYTCIIHSCPSAAGMYYSQCRHFESVCECSRYTATKKLQELVKAGKLRAMGAKNVQFYVKGSL